jgi:hypothetical protein
MFLCLLLLKITSKQQFIFSFGMLENPLNKASMLLLLFSNYYFLLSLLFGFRKFGDLTIELNSRDHGLKQFVNTKSVY